MGGILVFSSLSIDSVAKDIEKQSDQIYMVKVKKCNKSSQALNCHNRLTSLFSFHLFFFHLFLFFCFGGFCFLFSFFSFCKITFFKHNVLHKSLRKILWANSQKN